MRRVVAAVDLSGLQRRVADRARLIAEEHDARLTLLHAVPTLNDVFLDQSEMKAMQVLRRDSTENLALWLRSRTEIPIDINVPIGPPARVVAREARKADIVVVGTSSLDPASVGPTTRRIARKSRTPVVAVRRQPRVPYRRVLVGVDFSEESRKAIEFAVELAPEADLTAVYSLPVRFDSMLADAGISDGEIAASRFRRLVDAEKALDEFVGRWTDRVRTLVIEGPPGETVQEIVRRRSADLVVVGARGASADAMVLLGTVAEAVLGTAPCDVAVARVGGAFRRP